MLFPEGDYDLIQIDAHYDIPETNRNNNTWSTTGLFHKAEPLKLQFLAGLNDPEHATLYWLPTFGWSYHDGLYLGAAFHNMELPSKKLEFYANIHEK